MAGEEGMSPEDMKPFEQIAMMAQEIADLKAQLAACQEGRETDQSLWQKVLAGKNDRIVELERVMKIDERRLIDAANKAEIEYMGCDTPDAMADIVVDLRAAVIAWKAKVAR